MQAPPRAVLTSLTLTQTPSGPLSVRDWRIEVTRVLASVGTVRWHEGEPVFGRSPEPVRPTRLFAITQSTLERMQWPGQAFAHPGHYDALGSTGEVIVARTLDLTSTDAVSLGAGRAYTGETRSASLTFVPALGAGADDVALRGATLWIEARVTGSRTFVVSARFGGERTLEGMPARASVGAASGTWAVTLDRSAWFSSVDFDELAGLVPASADRFELGPEHQAWRAIERGLLGEANWRFAWSPNASTENSP